MDPIVKAEKPRVEEDRKGVHCVEFYQQKWAKMREDTDRQIARIREQERLEDERRAAKKEMN
ncbi:hypothetical protein N7495_006733 [Penicillium taxi]|uniref:uncharacterized protein n=1 Tax=Penicillium taxi TaxID=168475 RepID=UPI002545A205|nr:uncharacterized protein N7495_006733 [Penicillium taxi]KAJ5895042.1 hypothetical protein N7495_006733 [Penicillium taxi]